MKEYICKEEVLKEIFEPIDGYYQRVENLPTITKANICKEFAEKVKQMMKTPEYGFCDIERIMEIALAEMES